MRTRILSAKRRAITEVEGRSDELIGLSHRIYASPELAFEEHKAAAWLCGFLESAGLRVERGICELPTAFRAVHGEGGGPRVALVAEYDALRGLGHACGHNIIGTAAVGAAVAVARALPALQGEVLVLGTPAEEGGRGKVLLLERGAFDGLDAAMMIHPDAHTDVRRGSLASTRISVEFHGRAAHAAAEPEQGINALDALLLSFANLNALRQHIRSSARIHGIITDGGQAVNVVPAHAAGRFSVRAADNGYLAVLQEKVLDCFRAGAQATGARFTYRLSPGYQALRINRSLAEAFAANLRALGGSVPEPSCDWGVGSTDMGNVSHVVPSIHPYIAIAQESAAIHSPEFAAAAASPQGDAGLLLAAKAMALTTIDLAMDGVLLAGIRREFEGLGAGD